MNIVLIGFRGSGKTSIGREVAALLGRPFVDTDALIVQAAGKTIREIFVAEGESGFRRREVAAIASAAEKDNQVIALGGGAVLNPVNIAGLKARQAKVVWLRASPETLYTRIQADSSTNASRPNLTAAGGLEEVKNLLAARLPLYEAAADATLDVGGISVEEAARKVAALWPH